MSENIIKTNKSITRIVAEGTFWTSFYSMMTKIVSIVSAVVVLRYLSISEYGLSELATSVVAMLSIFMLPGMLQVIIADVSSSLGKGEGGRAKEILHNFFRLQIILSLFAFLLMFFIHLLATNIFTENVSSAIFILSFSFLLVPLRNLFTIIFIVTKSFYAQGIFSFLDELFRLFLILFLFNYTEMRLEGVFLGSVIGQCLATVIIFPLFLKLYKPINIHIKTQTQNIFESLILHGKWSVFSSYFNTFGQNMRLWIIQLFLGTNAVSIFSLALNMFIHTQSLVSLSGTMSPIIAEHNADKRLINKIVSKAIKYQFIVFGVISLGGVIFMPVLVNYLFPKYITALPIYYIFLFTMIPTSFAGVFTAMFHAKKAQKSLFNSISIKNAFIVLLSVIFVPIFGIIGSVIEYFITSTFFAIERYFSLKKIYIDFNLNLKDMLKYDDLDKKIVNKIFSKYKKIF